MSVTYVGQWSGSGSLAGISASTSGDLDILACWMSNDGTTIDTPTGFTRVNGGVLTSFTGALFIRRCTGSEGSSVSITYNGSPTETASRMMRYRGTVDLVQMIIGGAVQDTVTTGDGYYLNSGNRTVDTNDRVGVIGIFKNTTLTSQALYAGTSTTGITGNQTNYSGYFGAAYDALVDSGGSAALAFTANGTTSNLTGAGFLYVVRELGAAYAERDFNEGTDEAVPSYGSAGNTYGGTQTINFDNAKYHSASMAVRGTLSAHGFYGAYSMVSLPEHPEADYLRTYIWIDPAFTAVNDNIGVLGFVAYDGFAYQTLGANILWNGGTDYRLRLSSPQSLWDATAEDVTTGGANTFPVGQWVRVELYAPKYGGTWKARIFHGANLEGTTPDTELTAPNPSPSVYTVYLASGTHFAGMFYGNGTGSATNTFWVDDFAVDDAWLGPAAIGGAPVWAPGSPVAYTAYAHVSANDSPPLFNSGNDHGDVDTVAEAATGPVSANDATTTELGNSNAQAEAALATGTAYDATSKSSGNASAEAGTATAAAFDATTTRVNYAFPEVATVSVAANDPVASSSKAGQATAALGSITGLDATADSDGNTQTEAATGTVDAYQASTTSTQNADADAEAALVSVAGNDATTSSTANDEAPAEVAVVSGSALDSTIDADGNADASLAGVTGSALTSPANIGSAAVTATASVASHDPSVSTIDSVLAQDAAVSVSGLDATTTSDGNTQTEAATGTASAYQASTTSTQNADAPAVTALVSAVGNDATTSSTASDEAPAQAAFGTVTGLDATTTSSGNAAAGEASGTASALDALVISGSSAGNAAGSVVASDLDATASGNAESQAATGSVASQDATATASGDADAGEGTGVVTSYEPTVSTTVSVTAGVGSGAVTAGDATITVSANAEHGAASGTAYAPTLTSSGSATASEATVTVAALVATGQTSESGSALAGAAAGTVVAGDGSIPQQQPVEVFAYAGAAYARSRRAA